MLIRAPRKRVILICVCGWHQTGWKETKYIDPMWKVLNKEVDLGEPTAYFDHVYLECTQRQCETSKDIVVIYRTMFESGISAGATGKITMLGKICVFLRGHMTWKVMPRNVWNDIVSWQTGRLNNSTKYVLHALMTIISKKKKWNPWERCQKYALKLFWNAYTWHVLEDLIFYGQWTNLHDRSQNGRVLITNDYHVITNNIFMWETLANKADWDCVKTPILQEILRIQNLHQVEPCCAFLDVVRLFQSVGCVRNKLQFRTVK